MEKSQINGRNVFTLTPKHGASGKHILYIHGGAYVQNFKRPHWDFITLLIKNLNCSVTAPDYPLAPVNTYTDAFAMLTPLYQELISRVKPENLILMGDSAGGGLTLSLAQKMKNEQVDQPSQIILLSPWLDISLTNPDIIQIDPLDYFLDVKSLQRAGRAYAGNLSLDNYLVSPINGPLEGLGKISLFIGSKDILLADARKFKKLAESKGIEINYFEYPDMIHVWMLLNFPESKKAKKQIIELINQS
ncbi:MAG: alpha/beta hydrolase [Bacteroidota bacterium]|nr:alpha/beta hydrolase [Bacteroidota bacterium]